MEISHHRARAGKLQRGQCTGLIILALVLLAGCARHPFNPERVEVSTFLDRALSQSGTRVTVRTAVPDAQETEQLTGLDLYAAGIQPVWLEISNRGALPARFAPWSLDSDYYSPLEVAYQHRGDIRKDDYPAMERWFLEHAMPRRIPPGETRAGFVFTHRHPGTKGFDLDVFVGSQVESFTFFVPMPGFVPDYAGIDFETLYPAADLQSVAREELLPVLAEAPYRYATNAAGDSAGAPLNLVLLGSQAAMGRSLLRGHWLEAPAGGLADRARQQHFLGSPPHGLFYRARGDGSEFIVLALWLSPLRVGNEPVWVGQTYYWSSARSVLGQVFDTATLRNSRLLNLFLRESVMADIDAARTYTLQNFWYHQSIGELSVAPGIEPATLDDPGIGFGGAAWVTDGRRGIVQLSADPVALDEWRYVRPEMLGAGR